MASHKQIKNCRKHQKMATIAAAAAKNKIVALKAEKEGMSVEEYRIYAKKKCDSVRHKVYNDKTKVERNKKWRANNREKVRSMGRNQDAKRRALKINAKPSWAIDEYIKLFYELAIIEEKRTGLKVQVDHIVPLMNDKVCGLHCEANLQLLTAKQNNLKGNRFEL